MKSRAQEFADRCASALATKYPLQWNWDDPVLRQVLAGSWAAFDAVTEQQERRQIPPPVEEVAAYFKEISHDIEAAAFMDFYEAKGWKVGGVLMKSWRATARNWKRYGWGRTGGLAAPRAQSASLGALQIALDNVRTEIKGITNPGGAAWPKSASQLSPMEMLRVQELEMQRDNINKRIREFSA